MKHMDGCCWDVDGLRIEILQFGQIGGGLYLEEDPAMLNGTLGIGCCELGGCPATPGGLYI